MQSTKVSFIISAIDAVHQSYQLQALVSSTRYSLSSQEEIMEMHLLIALSKLVSIMHKSNFFFVTLFSHILLFCQL